MNATATILEQIASHLEAITAGLSAIAIAGTCAVDVPLDQPVEPVDQPVDQSVEPVEPEPVEVLPLDEVVDQVEALAPLEWVVGWDEDGVPIADDADNLVIFEDGSVAFPMWCGFAGWDGPVETLSGEDWSEVTDYWLLDEIDVCF